MRAMMDYMHWNQQNIKDRMARHSRRSRSGCLEWTGALIGGYGYIQMGSRTDDTRRVVKVHRLAWERSRGPIPLGAVVCHRCDNKRCFEVAHLFLGSPRDNTLDAAKKGLLSKKPSPDAVREIRRLLGIGLSGRKVAKRAGVSHGAIQAIAEGRTHAHVA